MRIPWPARDALADCPDFRRWWTGQTVSMLGDAVTGLAIPLVALTVLGAGPADMGLLVATRFAPSLLVSLLVGVWVDRLPRRPILLLADLLRALLLASIPVAASQQALTLWHLGAVAFLAGICRVSADLAGRAYLPTLVPADRLVAANGRVWTSMSLAQVAGPPLAGTLIQATSAPFAIWLDVASFLFSAGCLSTIRAPERHATATAASRNVWHELVDGGRFLLHHPVLRAAAATNSTFNLFFGGWQALFVLYLTRGLGLDAAQLGLVIGAGGPGALVGALLVGRLPARIGFGRSVIGAFLLGSAANLAVPALPPHPSLAVVPVVAVSQFLFGLSNPLYNAPMMSARQAVIPDHLQGRVQAFHHFLSWGAIPLGSILLGLVGTALGPRAALALAAVGGLAATGWLLASPLVAARSLNDLRGSGAPG